MPKFESREKLDAYLKACGGSDTFEFLDPKDGTPDPAGAYRFVEEMRKILPEAAISTKVHIVTLKFIAEKKIPQPV